MVSRFELPSCFAFKCNAGVELEGATLRHRKRLGRRPSPSLSNWSLPYPCLPFILSALSSLSFHHPLVLVTPTPLDSLASGSSAVNCSRFRAGWASRTSNSRESPLTQPAHNLNSIQAFPSAPSQPEPHPLCLSVVSTHPRPHPPKVIWLVNPLIRILSNLDASVDGAGKPSVRFVSDNELACV